MKITLGGFWIVVCLLVSLSACDFWPTQEEVEEDLESELRSVVGAWQGIRPGDPRLLLRFELVATGGSLAGTGWHWPGDSADSTAVGVTGTYERPDLELNFTGWTWEGETGTARFQAQYVSVGGIVDTLRVTTPGHSESVVVHLFER